MATFEDPGFAPDAREQLRQHFLDKPASESTGRWDELWQRQVIPWDRRLPNPALIDTLIDKTSIIGSPLREVGGRKRAFVPGCGRGYDVLLFASYGYDSYGLDASKTAIEACRKLEEEEGDTKYAAKDAKIGKGRIKFVFGDFFQDEWFDQTEGGSFDLVYDYTFLCALPPELRPAWAKRQSQLLARTGHMICLEFPTYKAPSAGGPPHGLTPELYVELLHNPGENVDYDKNGYTVAKDRPEGSAGKRALVRVAHWQPQRTHEVGKGSDWVSIWRHA